MDPYLENPVRARWTTEAHLRRRSALVPTKGRGALAWDGTEIDYRSDDGSVVVQGRVAGAAVVRPWAPWLRLVLEWVLIVGVLAAVDLWFGSTSLLAGAVAGGTAIWLPSVYQQLRTPFLRIDGVGDDGGPFVLHLLVKPFNPFRPDGEAATLADALRRAAHRDLAQRLEANANA